MRVAIVDYQVAFIHGGAEMLVSRLVEAVRGHGHDVEVVRIPLNPRDPRDVERAMEFGLAEDLGRYIATPDIVIGLRFPGYLVQHPDKRVWLLHQLRQYYEYYEQTRSAGNAEHAAHVERVRKRMEVADREALAGASRLWAQSVRIARRLQQYNGIFPPPLYPPLPSEEGFYGGRQERYIFAPSRLERHKRQWLLIEAMRHVKSDVKVVISGDGGAWSDYRRQVEEAGLSGRVLMTGRLPHGQQAAWYANCLAVFFCPEDEDYGFVTLEAMLSGKPVITARDSGATLEFVTDGENGWVVEPAPEVIAQRIDAIAAAPARAREMGAAGRERYRKLDLTWERTAGVLLQKEKSA
jgi:glycosyltransferase involved in cell wall biosynthesis